MDTREKCFYTSFTKQLAVLFVVTMLTTPLTSVAAFSGILPVPSTSPLVVLMSNYELTAGQTAVVTFTFSPTSAPASFTESQITASNGTISNLTSTADPLVYTATFTPAADVSSADNTISVNVPFATTTYATGVDPQGIAFDGTNMWTANNSGSVTKVSPSGSVTSYAVSGYIIDIAFDGTNMWAANYYGGVTKVSSNGATTTYSDIGNNPNGIAFDGTNMWVANLSSDSVTKISPSGATTTYAGIGSSPRDVAFDGTNIWTVNASGNSVTRISPLGATTTYSGTGNNPQGIAFDGVNMWTTNVSGGGVTKITPLGATTTYAMPTSPNAIAFDGTNMWTANSSGNSVTKISPDGATTVVYGTGPGTSPGGIAFDGVNMWTANSGGNSVTKIAPAFTVNSSNYTVNTTSTRSRGSSYRRVTSPTDSLNQMSATTSNQKSSTFTFTRNLAMGSTGLDVRALQVHLNSQGFLVASSGPGSLGNETTTFGTLTRSALGRFQKAHAITPTLGYFGPITRALLKK